jgi:hypothetical protein
VVDVSRVPADDDGHMATQTDITTRPHSDWLSRRQRQAVLVLHIVSAVGWIGVDLALIPLVLTGLTTDDGATAAAAYEAVAILVPWTVPALSLLIVTTGVLLGLGTKWGLVRYWWVAVKLVISLILTMLVFTSLLPAVTSIDVAASTSGDGVRAALDDPAVFLYPPVVSSLMLLTAVVLSVTKPWGRRSRARAR